MDPDIKIPPVVSHRNHVHTADDLVEMYGRGLPAELRSHLLRYTETIIRMVAFDYAKAAELGIAQMAELMCDLAYYTKQKERRKRQRENQKKQEEIYHQEMLERRLAPTPEQIAGERESLRRRIEWAKKDLDRCTERLLFLDRYEKNPKHVRFGA